MGRKAASRRGAREYPSLSVEDVRALRQAMDVLSVQVAQLKSEVLLLRRDLVEGARETGVDVSRDDAMAVLMLDDADRVDVELRDVEV